MGPGAGEKSSRAGRSFFRSLCCTSASPPNEPGPRPRRVQPAEKAQTEKSQSEYPEATYVTEKPNLPSPPSHFIRYLSENADGPVRKLLEPYLRYETQLRKAFAQDTTPVDGLANLLDIYSGEEGDFKIQDFDRNGSSSGQEKFLMRLPEPLLRPCGSSAIVGTFPEYQRNFDAFTHACLHGIDWTGVVAAGSSALLPLLPRREDVAIPSDPAVEDPSETYYQKTAFSSDIDLFIYGLDEAAALQKIRHLERKIRKNQRLSHGRGLTLRTENAITFVSPKWPYRHVQIILRLYKSISEILTGFDVDCACVAFDGKHVYTNPRGVAAIATRTNLIDLTRRSPSYETRLFKYRNHHFDAYWEPLDRTRINPSKCTRISTNPEVKGLARLIFYETITGSYRAPGGAYLRRRLLKKIDEHGEPTPSGYTSFEIPYGERFNARKIQKFVGFHSKEPYVFGDIDEVLDKGAKPSKKNQGKLNGRLEFIKDNPGRQMIGSFHPLTEDDWTEMAYAED